MAVDAADIAGAADVSGNGGGVWVEGVGGYDVVVVVAAAVSLLLHVCYWNAPSLSQVPLLSQNLL